MAVNEVWSFFSGVGGFDLGLERAGFRVTVQCEADPWRRKVLAARFPNVALYEDVRTFGADLRSERPHLLCGGFPCQDLSVAGKRRGFDGDRSVLFYEFARIADESQAEWLLIENVPGLFSSHSGADFGALLEALADIGYEDVAWRVLDSRFFGVPQRRRRVFILARRGRGESASTVLLDPQGGYGSAQEMPASGEAVAGTLGGGSGTRGFPDDLDRCGAYLPARQGDGFVLTDGYPDSGVIPWVENQRSEVRIVGDGTYVGALPAQPGQKQAPMLAFPDPAGTLTTRYAKGINSTVDDGAVIVRRLTPIECERLQGFPDNWTCLCESQCSSLEPGCPVGKRISAMGDAVTVPVIEWIGRRILET